MHARRGLLTLLALAALLPPVAAGAAQRAKASHTGANRWRAYAGSPYYDAVAGQVPGPPAWQHDYQDEFVRDQMVGVHWSYVFVRWSDIENAAGQIDVTPLDPLVVDARAHGILLVFGLETCDFSAPMPPTITGGQRTNTAQPAGSPEPPCAPVNIEAALPAWAALVQRFRPGGTLAEQEHWTDGYGVAGYEVENEPDALAWVTGNWSQVPKDYALYLSALYPMIKGLDPKATIVAPALSTDDGPAWAGVQWLERMLSTSPGIFALWSSDQYRAAAAHGMPIVGGGPFFDALSYHEDNPNFTTDVLVARPAELRELLVKYSAQASYPTCPRTPLWMSEGDATSYSGTDQAGKLRYSWAELQIELQSLSAGVQKVALDNFGAQGSDAPAEFATDPAALQTTAMTQFFPSYLGVRSVSSQFTGAAGQAVDAYSWTNPGTGLRSLALWARDEPMGSGATGASFLVRVPVRSAYALVIDSSWDRRLVKVRGGVVAVTLSRGDPSPPVLVIGMPR